MNRDQNKKKMTPGKWIAIAVALLAAEPELFATVLVLAIIVLPIYLLIKTSKQRGNAPAAAPAKQQNEVPFDDCPKTFCFHRDKGEHHVRKGREMDPWDRPDIDISKYQRKK